MTKPALPTEFPRERAILVGVELHRRPQMLSAKDSLVELTWLAATAGLHIVASLTQRLRRVNAATFIGSGKVQELKDLIDEVVADTVIFDDELSARHQRELETRLGTHVKILDRTALILDIFAQHARTREGALQVELAQYEYRLTRLTRQWTHLARQAGGGAGRTGAIGGVGLHGPGETQLEVDRREIGRRITYLKAELLKVRAHRARQRMRRKRSDVPVVAIVGYTNAGKSTLLRALSQAEIRTEDELFTTLDPTTRRVKISDGQHVLMTDTVGFINKLPATVVAAFRATLEEIADADLVLHVVDVTHHNSLEQAQIVEHTLNELELDKAQVVTALNKIDGLGSEQLPDDLLLAYPSAVPISALTGTGLQLLLDLFSQRLNRTMVNVDLLIPYADGHLLPLFHKYGQAEKVEHSEEGVILVGRLARRFLGTFKEFLR